MATNIFRILLTFLLAIGTMVPASAECYAFAKSGNIYLRCGNDTKTLTKSGDVEQFAISSQIYEVAMVQHGSAPFAGFIDLKSGTTTKDISSKTILSFHDTCGGIVKDELIYGEGKQIRTNPVIKGNAYRSTLMGDKSVKSPFSQFRCDKERNIIIGTRAEAPNQLQEQDSSSRSIVDGSSDINFLLFSISPNGKYVGYTTDDNYQLCVLNLSITHGKSCSNRMYMIHSLSISDEGRLIFEAETGHFCYFHTPAMQSSVPKRGWQTGECTAVWEWQPGWKSARMLEEYGVSPQWVDDSVFHNVAQTKH